MIFDPNDIRNRDIIKKSIDEFYGYQICVSLRLSSGISKYDRIEFLNGILKLIYRSFRDVNRRNYINNYLIVLSNDVHQDIKATILIEFIATMLSISVDNRMRLILRLLEDVVKKTDGLSSNIILQADQYVVMKRYSDLSYDIQRYHFRDILKTHDSLSITKVFGHGRLEIYDWAAI
jgi:hypothetical protein